MNKTLWHLLNKQKVEIPIIQRDYAQGRKGKEHLREKFLGKLIEALKKDEELSLDFVYGSIEDGSMQPLDGQQRLTTLWLLHWYIAVKNEVLKENASTLMNFTYKTRIESSDFCKSLCSKFDAKDFNLKGQHIEEYIKDQTWYLSKYDQDPTIQGMIRMLNGTNGNTINDGIEKALIDCEPEDFVIYWKELTTQSLITFEYKDLKDEDMPLSDDLYVKMNARGKQLTSFENFKAELLDYEVPNAKQEGKEEAVNVQLYDNKLIDINTASLIDNKWTDVFWNYAVDSKVFAVDEIYFEFLKRYFLNVFIANSGLAEEDIENSDTYKALYNEEEGAKPFEDLSPYKPVLNAETLKGLTKFFDNWKTSCLKNSSKILYPNWGDDSFKFIPEYTDKGKSITSITKKQRCVFYAICIYFEKNKYEETSFANWMRIIWNIAENSNGMTGCIRLFKELGEYSNDILKKLGPNNIKLKSSFASEQIAEERFKAKLILGRHGNEWKSAILEAESNSFFRGNIACLLRKDTNAFINDIVLFKEKFTNASKYFEEGGIKEEYRIPLTKTLLKLCTKWGQIQEQEIFDSSENKWKTKILNDKDQTYAKEINTILTTRDIYSLKFIDLDKEDASTTDFRNEVKKNLAQTEITDDETDGSQIIYINSKWRIVEDNDLIRFYPKNGREAYLFDWNNGNSAFRRNELLSNPDIIVSNSKFGGIYWGYDVVFTYKDHNFRWDRYNKIALCDNNNEPLECKDKEDNSHYEINMWSNGKSTQTMNDFLKSLSELIDKYNLECK